MIQKSTRFIVVCLSLFLVILSTISLVPASAAEPELPSLAETNAVWFYHLEEQSLICSKNDDTQIPAGSTVKVLAGLIACETLKDRGSEFVNVTEEMISAASGYRLKLKAGDVLTVEQLLYAAVCGSYNDAFDVLAHLIGGNREEFVKKMNQRAKELGAVHTLCTDPSGIDDGSLTTVSDVASIALAAYQNELFMKISSTARYPLNTSAQLAVSIISNRNALIYSDSTTQYYNAKCKGMSAGSTARGGNCVVTVASNGRESYLCVVMGASDAENVNYGYAVTNRLINWVYQTYSYTDVITAETVLCTIPVTVSDMTSEVEVKTHETLSCYLPKDLEIGVDITYSIRLMYSSLEAPVLEGTFVGYVAVLWNDQTLGTIPLYTAGAAERSGFVSALMNIRALTESRVFCAGAIFFAVTLVAWIVTEYVIILRKRHKWDKYFSEKMNPPLSIDQKRRK